MELLDDFEDQNLKPQLKGAENWVFGLIIDVVNVIGEEKNYQSA